MQNLGTLWKLFLGDLADDGKRREEEREQNALFIGHFVALAHALHSDQEKPRQGGPRIFWGGTLTFSCEYQHPVKFQNSN
jgi:hypothetical protein